MRAPAVHDAVAFLLEHLPPALHLVIASREDPSLPLPRRRARRQLVEVRTVNLGVSVAGAGGAAAAGGQTLQRRDRGRAGRGAEHVKTHRIHVYSDLGVHSRTQAVARARGLRLLD